MAPSESVLFYGSYDERRHPRVRVLRQGLVAVGFDVVTLNVPLRDSASERAKAATSAVAGIRWLGRLLRTQAVLVFKSLRWRRPGCVVVGYLGVLDVLIARIRWPRTPIILDHLAPLEGIAYDRALGKPTTRLLRLLDRLAVAVATIVVFDTTENEAAYGATAKGTIVVPVGAPTEWFDSAHDGRASATLRVIFFGTFVPLQGVEIIGQALARLADADIQATIVGGRPELMQPVSGAYLPHVRWIPWLTESALIDEVRGHHVCLGIFGGSQKAQHVVPNKVYQGAAAGCVIVTSDTAPQRRALADAGVYVPAGDSDALANALKDLAVDRLYCSDMKKRTRERARAEFAPEVVTRSLSEAIRNLLLQC